MSCTPEQIALIAAAREDLAGDMVGDRAVATTLRLTTDG